MRTKFSNILDHIIYFKELIDFEREEDKKRHLGEIKKYSGEKREAMGRCLLNLKGKDAGRGLGNSYLVKLKANGNLKKTQIGVSDLVILTNKKKPTGKEMCATVVEKTQNNIIVSYPTRPSSFVYEDELRLDLFTNDVVYLRQTNALSKLKGNHPLIRNLIGRDIIKEENKIQNIEFENKNLNQNQKKAVEESLKKKDFFLLHGPPGTGKTTTLVESIIQHVNLGQKILVCCDSNVGVDNILEKIIDKNINVVRVGNPARVDLKLQKHTIDYLIQKEEFFSDAKMLWRQVEKHIKTQKESGATPTANLRRGLSDSQIKKAASKRKAFRGVPAPLLRKMALWIDVQKLINENVRKAKILENLCIEQVLTNAQVICTTNSTAGSDIIEDFVVNKKKEEGKTYSFDVCFVDESTQAVEPSTLIPMNFAPKLILAGDHKQLPPTVLSFKAEGLKYSLFERLIDLYNKENSLMLNVQYRMNEKIQNFSNKNFYENNLIADNSCKDKLLKVPKEIQGPIIFYDIKGEEERRENSTSFFNIKECIKVKETFEKLISSGIKKEDIGIITPYDLQVKTLTDTFEDEEVSIKSIDGFQGAEKEVIIISFVRTNGIGFLKDYRRLNVAITRAKKLLILIGDKDNLCSDEIYNKLIKSII